MTAALDAVDEPYGHTFNAARNRYDIDDRPAAR